MVPARANSYANCKSKSPQNKGNLSACYASLVVQRCRYRMTCYSSDAKTSLEVCWIGAYLAWVQTLQSIRRSDRNRKIPAGCLSSSLLLTECRTVRRLNTYCYFKTNLEVFVNRPLVLLCLHHQQSCISLTPNLGTCGTPVEMLFSYLCYPLKITT